MNKEKRPYEAPALTVVTFKVEKGYTSSLVMQRLNLDIFLIENDNHFVESRTDGGCWGGNDWND